MEKKTSRLEAFSDGIFGVAITLLAIEIGISQYQNPTNLNLWERIFEKWGEYFAYFNSFATVLLGWMGHHKILNKIWKPNQKIILANGLVLLILALFPFPTKTVGAFINTPAINTAVAFYCGYILIFVLSVTLLNWIIISQPENVINAEKNIPWFKNQIKQQIVAIIIYGLAVVLAFYTPYISLGITFLMWVFWAVVTKDSDNDE
ncbi:MAG: DUF1211 domain-containing protein [Bacteroidetes bacterium]|nr:DUF1211 domain-containing protein [Bacteroidota bacterium]